MTEKIIFPITEKNYLEVNKYMSLIDENDTILLQYSKDFSLDPETFKKVYIYLKVNYPKIEFRIIDLPFCIYPEIDFDITNKANKQKKKYAICKKCKYQAKCGGLWKNIPKTNIRTISDIPSEVVIEVTSSCNLDCKFCFNSFPKNQVPDRPKDEIFSIIDKVKSFGVPFIRFTGGEPLLREDIFEILAYAKKQGLKVRLNTNSTLLNKQNIQELEKYVDYILLSYNGLGSISKISLAANSKIPTVMVGTVATNEAIKNLEKIKSKLPKNVGWEVYRPITKDTINPKTLVKKLLKINIPVANSFPFCAYDKKQSSLVSLGAKYDDGHSRIVLDPRGYYKPSYFLDINLGTDLKKAWNSKFMKDIRSLKFVPDYCKSCEYLQKCKGGSRYLAKEFYGTYSSIDPLFSAPLKHMVIKPTKKCPGKCIGCSSRQDLYKGMKETMTLTDWKRVIKDAHSLGLQKLTISGGEPTLYKQLPELIKFSKSLGITTLLNTTGLGLKPEEILDLDGITFSLESLDPKEDKKIRGVDYVSNILQSIKSLKGKMSININTIIARYNYKNMYKIQNLCKENNFTWLLSYPEYDFDKKMLPSRKQIEYVNKKLGLKIPIKYSTGVYNPKSCTVPSYFALVLPNGDVHPCNIVEYAHEPIVGNVKKNSLKKIWNSKEYQQFRSTKHKECKYCPVPLRIHKKI